MASIFKRGARWGYKIQVGIDPRTGKYKQKYSWRYKTKKEAVAAAAAAEAALSNGSYIEKSSKTFKEFANEWLAIYSMDVKPGSVRIRRHEVGLLNEFFARVPLQAITARKYQRVLIALKKSNYADNTISGVHTTARMIFKKAREYKLIADDPTEFAKPPRQVSRSIEQKNIAARYLERDELLRLLDVAKMHGLFGDYAALTVLAYTGMRIGELLALTWDDVDIGDATISISKTLYCPDNNIAHYDLVSPKSTAGYRVIDVPPEVTEVLVAYHREYAKERLCCANIWHRDKQFVFTSPQHPGWPKTQKAMQVRIDRLTKMVNPPLSIRVTPHVFRHTHISLLAAAGVQLHEIMERVGQVDDEITKSVYLHVTRQRKREASRLFSNLMSGEVSG